MANKLLINLIAITVLILILPGISIDGPFSLILVTLVLMFLRAVVQPVLLILTFPFTIVTLGLFIFIVNGLVVMLAGWLVPGFTVSGIFSAIIFSLLLSLLNSLLESAYKDAGKPSRPKSAPKATPAPTKSGGSRRVGEIGV